MHEHANDPLFQVSAFVRLDIDPDSITWRRVMDVNDRWGRGQQRGRERVHACMCVRVWGGECGGQGWNARCSVWTRT
jgi:hypothetical protein